MRFFTLKFRWMVAFGLLAGAAVVILTLSASCQAGQTLSSDRLAVCRAGWLPPLAAPLFYLIVGELTDRLCPPRARSWVMLAAALVAAVWLGWCDGWLPTVR